MALPRTRQEFKQNILEDLGSPVISVNLAEAHLENAIDDALQFFQDYHHLGSTREYQAHQLTADNIETKTIELDPKVQEVIRIFKFNGLIGGFSTDELFNVNYQLRLSLFDLSQSRLSGYVIARQYIQLLDDVLNFDFLFRWNEYEGILHLDVQEGYLLEDQYVFIETLSKVDPATVPRIWSDRQLRKLAEAYARRTWGNILTKYQSVQLPGGVVMNGEKIWEVANEDIIRLEADFILKWQTPDTFFVY